jgi:hypothetical protein
MGNKTTFSEQRRGLDSRVLSGLQVAVIVPLDLSPDKMKYWDTCIDLGDTKTLLHSAVISDRGESACERWHCALCPSSEIVNVYLHGNSRLRHFQSFPSSVMVRQMTSAVFLFVIQSSVSNILFCFRQPNGRSCEHLSNSRKSVTPAGTFFFYFLQSLYDYAKLVPQIRRNPLLLHLLIINRRYYKFRSYFHLKTTPGLGHARSISH